MQYSHPAVAIDTGSLNPNLNGKVLPTYIELKFWGFSKADVQSILPVTRLNQESYFADSNHSSQYYTKAYSSYKESSDIVHNNRHKFANISPTYYDSLKLTSGPNVPTSSNDTKYLIIKVDDIGGSLTDWQWFYDLISSNSSYIVNLGVIAKRLQKNFEHQNYFKTNILNHTSQFGIYDHGWDHMAPEFQDRSVEYMSDHLKKWDEYMNNIGYNDFKFLGAPGNLIGNRSSCQELVYPALALNNYKGVFFSSCRMPENDAAAPSIGLNLVYAPFEDKLRPLPLKSIISNFDSTSQYKYVMTQIHPTYYWNHAYLKSVLDSVYSSTGRKGITLKDYYLNHFIKEYPNYLLDNSTKFLQSIGYQGTNSTDSKSDVVTSTITNETDVLTSIDNISITTSIDSSSVPTSIDSSSVPTSIDSSSVPTSIDSRSVTTSQSIFYPFTTYFALLLIFRRRIMKSSLQNSQRKF